MDIKAKFRCNQVDRHPTHEFVTFTPVYSDDKTSENYSWSKYTPSGKLEMSITNNACWGKFNPGDEYYLILSPVPKEAK